MADNRKERRAKAKSSKDPNFHLGRANELVAKGKMKPAIHAYRVALKLDPDLPEASTNMAIALGRIGNYDEAIDVLKGVVADHPDFIHGVTNLGVAYAQTHRHEEAMEMFRRCIEIEPDHAWAHSDLGRILANSGRFDEGLPHLEKGYYLRRRDLPAYPEQATYRYATKSKLLHDAEQFRYLAGLGIESEIMEDHADIYQGIVDLMADDIAIDRVIELPEPMRARIADSYNRAVRHEPPDRLEGPAVNPDLDVAAITSAYFDTAPGITFFDDFLVEEALLAVRKFLLESTFWYDFNHTGGYLGAYIQEGFIAPLLIQIADELSNRFPTVFRGANLRHLWSYKYNSDLNGIGPHADEAFVNLNFWLTPDAANLDPDHGGLIVYKTEAPLDWDLEKFNAENSKLMDYQREHDQGSITVPHKQNRAVMFNSNIIHETDRFHFREGYENRRMNVTMLFGDRGRHDWDDASDH